MAVVMSKGANAPVPQAPVLLRLHWRHGAGVPDAWTAALLVTGDGRVAPDGVVGGDRPVPGGAVRHEGRTTTGDRTAETLHVDLPAVPAHVDRVVLVAVVGGGTFGAVPGLDVTVADAAGDRELARYESRDTTTETAFVAGELYRRQGGWKFRAVGQGYAGGAAELAAAHGLAPGLLPAPRTPAAPPPAPPPSPSPRRPPPSPSPSRAPPPAPSTSTSTGRPRPHHAAGSPATPPRGPRSTSTSAPSSSWPTAPRASSRRSATPSATSTARRGSTSTATTAPVPSPPARTSPSTSTTPATSAASWSSSPSTRAPPTSPACTPR